VRTEDYFLVKNYIEGRTLADWLAKGEFFQDGEVRTDFAKFIQEMVAKKVIFSDLNSTNLIFDENTKKWQLVDSTPEYKKFNSAEEALDEFKRMIKKEGVQGLAVTGPHITQSLLNKGADPTEVKGLLINLDDYLQKIDVDKALKPTNITYKEGKFSPVENRSGLKALGAGAAIAALGVSIAAVTSLNLTVSENAKEQIPPDSLLTTFKQILAKLVELKKKENLEFQW
jgi:hypothetical protein